jgi:hypothetical protein
MQSNAQDTPVADVPDEHLDEIHEAGGLFLFDPGMRALIIPLKRLR